MGESKSTSIHSMNADRGLGFFGKLAYLLLNFINNLFPYFNVDRRISIRTFNDPNLQNEFDGTYKESSVGRRLSDIFWRTLPWEKIEEELGEIHIFDTGCGHGNYGTRLMDASGGRVTSYTGVDAKARPNWVGLKKKFPGFNFIESTSSDISELIPKETNLFVTQSAIEHFDEDIKFFEQIKDFIENSNKPIIQIHNFPSRAVLPLYLFHGLRQYTPRTISKITRIFKKSSFYLYGLGGRTSKIVQWKYFTWPLLILRRKANLFSDLSKYDKEVREAILLDSKSSIKLPLFWVIIIHSNLKKEIW